MRKELLWAGVIGIAFGLIVGFGFWRVKTSVVTKTKLFPSPTPQAVVGMPRIVIAKPSNLDVITTTPLQVTGVTKALNWVIVSTEGGDYLSQSASDGSFSVNADLVSGLNHIQAVSIDNQGNSSSQNILGVYSAAFQATTSTPNAATGEAEIAKEVAERLAAKQPKSYIGTVTDIADSTIQIKSTDSQIQQIATDKLNPTVVNIKGTTNKTVKTSDIAIGDFVIAMGYVDGNEVLDAQRILIANSLDSVKITISIRKVTSVSKKTVTLMTINDSSNSVVTPDKNTTLASYSDGSVKNIPLANFKTGDNVIVVSDTTGTPEVIRSLFNLGSEY